MGERVDTIDAGESMHGLIERLFPITRSITGNGVRETLAIIGEHLPLQVHEVASGTRVLDWEVPREWNVTDAWIEGPNGETIVDFADNNLHLMSYSSPVSATLSLDDLRPRLHSLPEHPDWIPYRTSYYNEDWGFCLTDRQLSELADGEYRVFIDSTLEQGSLTYGELLIPGTSDEEVLLSTHICHPSLANDNLSGVAVAVELAKTLLGSERRYSYRFVFVPGTIGSITWLAQNESVTDRIAHGLTLVCLGDGSPYTYKRTISGDCAIDRVVPKVLVDLGHEGEVIDFFPYGYDERQYNSPGFRMPVGSLMRGRHGEFPEYHTSGDNLAFVTAANLASSLNVVREVVSVLEGNQRVRSLAPKGEPQLGRRGIYRATGGESDPGEVTMAMLWVLALADGEHDLIEISTRAAISFDLARRATTILLEHDLLEVVG